MRPRSRRMRATQGVCARLVRIGFTKNSSPKSAADPAGKDAAGKSLTEIRASGLGRSTSGAFDCPPVCWTPE